MDYLDCVVHIFTPAARDYYRLETLWGEVPALEVEEAESWRASVRRDRTSVRIAMDGDRWVGLTSNQEGRDRGVGDSRPATRRWVTTSTCRWPEVGGATLVLEAGRDGSCACSASGVRIGGGRQSKVWTKHLAPTPRERLRRTTYGAHEVDAVAIYCPNWTKCFRPTDLAGRRQTYIHLRVEPYRTDSSSGVKWARDYALGL